MTRDDDRRCLECGADSGKDIRCARCRQRPPGREAREAILKDILGEET